MGVWHVLLYMGIFNMLVVERTTGSFPARSDGLCAKRLKIIILSSGTECWPVLLGI